MALWAGYRYLPRERWQVIACIPLRRLGTDRWLGQSLTYYGFLLACAGTVALGLAFLLLAAIGVGIRIVVYLTFALVLASAAASRLVARAVEGKRQTFTVAGAGTAGLLLIPPLVAGVNLILGTSLCILPVLAALLVAYLFGEGLGRLACISYGCCYGRPVHELRGVSRRLFSRIHIRFQGATKKATYASGLEGAPLIPVQAMTAVLYTGTGLVALELYLRGRLDLALTTAAISSQGWRCGSEVLRADYRGQGRMTAYQWLALANLLIVLALSRWLAWPAITVDLNRGLSALWDPLVVFYLQGCFGFLFYIYGRSKVIEAELSFHVNPTRI